MTDEPEQNPFPADGIWRPEEWKNGRYLLIRHLPIEGQPALTKRELFCDGKFSAFARIYESAELAQQIADKLNAGEEVPAIPTSEEDDDE